MRMARELGSDRDDATAHATEERRIPSSSPQLDELACPLSRSEAWTSRAPRGSLLASPRTGGPCSGVPWQEGHGRDTECGGRRATLWSSVGLITECGVQPGGLGLSRRSTPRSPSWRSSSNDFAGTG